MRNQDEETQDTASQTNEPEEEKLEQDLPPEQRTIKRNREIRIPKSISITSIALLVTTAVAAGAIGYIIGTSNSTSQTQKAAINQQAPVPESQSPATLPQSTPQQTYNPEITIDQGDDQTSKEETGNERPEAFQFTGKALDNTEISLSDTIGTPTLLVFWSHW